MATTFERLPSHPTLGIIQDPIAQNAFDTRCTTLLMVFLISRAYLKSLNSRTLSLFATAAQNLHQWSECHAMSFDQDDVWTNPVNDATRGSRGGGRGPDPSPPGKSQILLVYIEICNWTPSPWEKLDPWKCWTVLLHGILESYSLMIFFFEKAMITGLPLQNKLRTYKKKKKKQHRQSFFSFSRAWTPPPLPAIPDENFLDPWIHARIYVIMVVEKRYRSIKPSIVLPRSNDHVYSLSKLTLDWLIFAKIFVMFVRFRGVLRSWSLFYREYEDNVNALMQMVW